jgi:hypothetical protein
MVINSPDRSAALQQEKEAFDEYVGKSFFILLPIRQ